MVTILIYSLYALAYLLYARQVRDKHDLIFRCGLQVELVVAHLCLNVCLSQCRGETLVFMRGVRLRSRARRTLCTLVASLCHMCAHVCVVHVCGVFAPSRRTLEAQSHNLGKQLLDRQNTQDLTEGAALET